MTVSETFTVHLPEDLVRLVRRKVASGLYASAEEVIVDGLRELGARDAEQTFALYPDEAERRLREALGPAYDAYMADLAQAHPVDAGVGVANPDVGYRSGSNQEP